MTPNLRLVRRVAAVLSTAIVTLPAAAAAAPATSGGASYGQPAGVTGGAGLAAQSQGMVGDTLRFRGITTPGRAVTIERYDPQKRTWLAVATTVADAQGAYLARWRADRSGVLTMRVGDDSSATAPAASATRAASTIAVAAAPITVTVFKPARATWYGPGLYGRRTACGQKLTTSLIGVAHRTLPCGSPVAVLYGGRSITVPVVDRGPFDHGAEWDLTAAAARLLGFTRTDRIGVVALPAAARI